MPHDAFVGEDYAFDYNDIWGPEKEKALVYTEEQIFQRFDDSSHELKWVNGKPTYHSLTFIEIEPKKISYMYKPKKRKIRR